MAANPDFDPFQHQDFHDEIRSAIRAISEKAVAPHAKDVDEKSRFPEQALAALSQSGFNATHVPEAFGGPGAGTVCDEFGLSWTESARNSAQRARSFRSAAIECQEIAAAERRAIGSSRRCETDHGLVR